MKCLNINCKNVFEPTQEEEAFDHRIPFCCAECFAAHHGRMPTPQERDMYHIGPVTELRYGDKASRVRYIKDGTRIIAVPEFIWVTPIGSVMQDTPGRCRCGGYGGFGHVSSSSTNDTRLPSERGWYGHAGRDWEHLLND